MGADRRLCGVFAVSPNAGDLNHQFDLQRPAAGVDPTQFDTIEAGVWGSITAVSQREALRFGVPTSEGQSVVKIYWRNDVRAKDQLVEQEEGRTLQILGWVDPTGDREQLDLLVVEVL